MDMERLQGSSSLSSSQPVSLAVVLIAVPSTDSTSSSPPQVRLIGNILLVVAYKQNYSNSNVAEWGFICQGLGYSFLVNATLSFYERAKDPLSTIRTSSPSGPKGLKGIIANPTPGKILHLITLVGLILLIAGYNDSNGVFPSNGSSSSSSNSNATLDAKAKIGDCIFLGVTILITILVFYSISKQHEIEARRIYQFILIALPFMFFRAIYVTYESFTKHPFNRRLWAKVLFEYITEIIVVIVYFILGYVVEKVQAKQNGGIGIGGDIYPPLQNPPASYYPGSTFDTIEQGYPPRQESKQEAYRPPVSAMLPYK